MTCVTLHTEQNIEKFMKCYRETFPQSTVLPKMHILEEHMVNWIKEWKLAAGLMGEQGAESIYAHFNQLETQFREIVNPLDRLKYTVNDTTLRHLLHSTHYSHHQRSTRKNKSNN